MRTEEDKVVQASITVILGGDKYDIPPLVIRDSRPWRKKVVELISSLPKYAEVTTDTPDDFAEALNAVMAGMPDTIIDLFFGYAKDLPREEIEGKATEAELAIAFNQVVEIAFPLAKSMSETMKHLAQ